MTKIALAMLLFLAGGFAVANESVTKFESSATVKQAMQQHHRLRTDDIWWTKYGEDMAWNFKNLHQIFPAAAIYRAGPVSTLEYNLMDEVANFPVKTPAGPMGISVA